MVEGNEAAATHRRRAPKPVSIEVHDEPGGRFVVATFADGEVVRTLVDPDEKPKRKPRKPYARASSKKIDRTRRKRF
jgi:hypothetical protein